MFYFQKLLCRSIRDILKGKSGIAWKYVRTIVSRKQQQSEELYTNNSVQSHPVS